MKKEGVKAARLRTTAKATAKRQAKFLTEYIRTGTILHAALAAKIHRKTHYKWLEGKRYAIAFAEAEELAIQELEREARRRALEGVSEPVGFWRGKASEYVKRYSDTLLIFLLKGHRPEKYRERQEIEHKGQIVSKVTIQTVDPDKAEE